MGLEMIQVQVNGKPGKDKLGTSQERASKEERSDAGSQQTKYSDH